MVGSSVSGEMADGIYFKGGEIKLTVELALGLKSFKLTHQ
jgi:hypothetical protein